MDDRRASELLARERQRIQDELRAAGLEPSDELSSTDLAKALREILGIVAAHESIKPPTPSSTWSNP